MALLFSISFKCVITCGLSTSSVNLSHPYLYPLLFPALTIMPNISTLSIFISLTPVVQRFSYEALLSNSDWLTIVCLAIHQSRPLQSNNIAKIPNSTHSIAINSNDILVRHLILCKRRWYEEHLKLNS